MAFAYWGDYEFVYSNLQWAEFGKYDSLIFRGAPKCQILAFLLTSRIGLHIANDIRVDDELDATVAEEMWSVILMVIAWIKLEIKCWQGWCDNMYWKSAQPRAWVRAMAERPIAPYHCVYRENDIAFGLSHSARYHSNNMQLKLTNKRTVTPGVDYSRRGAKLWSCGGRQTSAAVYINHQRSTVSYFHSLTSTA